MMLRSAADAGCIFYSLHNSMIMLRKGKHTDAP